MLRPACGHTGAETFTFYSGWPENSAAQPDDGIYVGEEMGRRGSTGGGARQGASTSIKHHTHTLKRTPSCGCTAHTSPTALPFRQPLRHYTPDLMFGSSYLEERRPTSCHVS